MIMANSVHTDCFIRKELLTMRRNGEVAANAVPEKFVEFRNGWNKDNSEYYAHLDEIQGKVILSDRELVIGGKVLAYASKEELERAVRLWLCNFREDENARVLDVGHGVIRDAGAEDCGGRTIEECIRSAVTYVAGRNGIEDKNAETAEQNKPLFLSEAWGMQDSLIYAMMDFPKAKPDDMFGNFVGMHGYDWWFDVTGVVTAVNILREFYDGYYSEMQSRDTALR